MNTPNDRSGRGVAVDNQTPVTTPGVKVVCSLRLCSRRGLRSLNYRSPPRSHQQRLANYSCPEGRPLGKRAGTKKTRHVLQPLIVVPKMNRTAVYRNTHRGCGASIGSPKTTRRRGLCDFSLGRVREGQRYHNSPPGTTPSRVGRTSMTSTVEENSTTSRQTPAW